MGRRSRKPRPTGSPAEDDLARGYARGRARDEALRASLEPLPKGERPRPVTVAAIVAFVMALANVIAAVAGANLGNEAASFTAFSTMILLACAAGMWFGARYWAVLGFMMILAFQILSISVALIRVERWWVGLILVVVIGLLGWLFYKLIRALSRIQMPDRPQPKPR